MRHVLGYGVMAFATAALLGVGFTAVAQDKTAAVTERQALMKSNGASAGKIAAFLQKGEGSAADVAAAGAQIAENLKKVPPLFVAGTSSADMPGKTRAKPEMFQNMAKVEGYQKAAVQRATELQDAAKAGDKEKMSAAFGALNREGCGGCHTDFRGPAQGS